MRIRNKRIEFKAMLLGKFFYLIPSVVIMANCNNPKWQDWAVEFGWLMFAVGFRVKPL